VRDGASAGLPAKMMLCRRPIPLLPPRLLLPILLPFLLPLLLPLLPRLWQNRRRPNKRTASGAIVTLSRSSPRTLWKERNG